MEDWRSFPQDCDRTFTCRYDNLSAAQEKFRDQHDESFFRMWHFFPLCAAGGFRSRLHLVWQIVLSVRSLPERPSPADIRQQGAQVANHRSRT